MSITLQKLCEESNYLYGMRVLAGEVGMNSVVQWVHTIEEEEACSFLHGGELIFTTGIAQKGDEWILSFVKKLKSRKVSGLVLNYGPYLNQVSPEVIKYCEEVNFPLLEVPWKTRLVDMTRDFCNQIIKAERQEDEIGEAFRNLIRYPYEAEQYLETLKENQFEKNGRYCVIGATFEYEEEREGLKQMDLHIRLELDLIFQSNKGQYTYYVTDDSENKLVVILNDFTSDQVRMVVDNLQDFGIQSGYFKTFYIAVSSNQYGIQNISKNYNIIQMVGKLARTQKRSPLYYDEFGIEKLLFSIPERDILESYYVSALGVLERFDQKNDTGYMEMLQKYIISDGSVQKVAEESGIHRNTVNYQIGKIKKILGNELCSWQDKVQVMLALQIKEIL